MATPALLTDEWLQQAVLSELKWDGRVHPNEVGVAVQDGIVTLTGTVDAYTKRWAAEEVVHRVRGVRAVANEIELHLPGDARRADAELAAAIAHALEWDALLPADRLAVTVSKGWVTLSGEVERACRSIGSPRGSRYRCWRGRSTSRCPTERSRYPPATS